MGKLHTNSYTAKSRWHLNRVIFNCLAAAASVPRHSQYLSLSPLSFTSLLTPSLLLLPSLLPLLSIPPPTSVCLYFPFSRHTHSLASSNTAPLSLFHNKLLEQGESVLQSLSSPVFLFRFLHIPAPPSANSSCDNYISSFPAVFFPPTD